MVRRESIRRIKGKMKREKDREDDPEAGYAAHTLRFIIDKAAWIFLLLVLSALVLDAYPEVKRAEAVVEEMVDRARGTHDSSTCMFYAKRLSEPEAARWRLSAAAEGRAKCIEADAVMRQSPMMMKAREFVYRYIPWSSGNLTGAMQNITWYLVYAMPIAGWFVRFLTARGGGGYPEFLGV